MTSKKKRSSLTNGSAVYTGQAHFRRPGRDAVRLTRSNFITIPTAHTHCRLSQSFLAAIKKYHRLGWLHQQKCIFSQCQRLESPRSSTDRIQFLMIVLFLDYRWLLCPYMVFPLNVHRERQTKKRGRSGISPSYKDSSAIRSGQHLYDLI